MSLFASSRQTSRSTFDRWASFYDNSRIIGHFTRNWDDRIARLNPSTPILDLGCATGRLANGLVRKGFQDVYGLDISLNCLKIAKKKAGDYQFYPAEGFLENLPFKDDSFSTAIFSAVFHHLEKPREAISEAVRVLKPSSKLIIIEANFIIGIRQIVNLALDIYPISGDRRFYSPQGIVGMVEAYGFVKKGLFGVPLSYILVFERC